MEVLDNHQYTRIRDHFIPAYLSSIEHDRRGNDE